MKKILSILGAIGLTATSTTSLTSCQKPNNNENGGGNKPKPKPQQKPQQPPENSNWKLITDWKDEEKNPGKTYIGIWGNEPDYKILNWKANPAQPKWPLYHFKIVYRWDGVDEPQIPTINSNTSEITDWKG